MPIGMFGDAVLLAVEQLLRVDRQVQVTINHDAEDHGRGTPAPAWSAFAGKSKPLNVLKWKFGVAERPLRTVTRPGIAQRLLQALEGAAAAVDHIRVVDALR